MAIFATINADSDFTGFYDTALYPEPPEGAVELTQAQWQDCIDHLGRRRWVDGGVVEYVPNLPTVPAAPRTCTPREFMDRFEDAEEEAIFAAAIQQPRLLRFVTRLSAATVVEPGNPELGAGMDALVAAGLLTRERADAILAGPPG